MRGRDRGREPGEGEVEGAKRRKEHRKEWEGRRKEGEWKACREEKGRVEKNGPWKEVWRGRRRS